MARENSFSFFGQVDGAPVVLFNEESKTFRVTFSLKTLRKNGRADYPKVSIYSLSEDEAKEYTKKLKQGVFVQLRGMLATKMIRKPVKCEACGTVGLFDTLQCEVITYGKPLVYQGTFTPAEISEFANVGCLIGSLCTDIQRRDNPNGVTAAQFQMAVNRRYRVNELERDTRTDYPWIKVFGETANECLKRLQKSSQVYLVGAFQTRDIERHVKCEKCEGLLVYPERVSEVIPNGVEFLNHCLFDKKKESTEEAVSEANTNEEA